jgi:hypothetical protein
MTTTKNITIPSEIAVQEQYVRNTQALAKHLASTQERSLKYTQGLFESTIGLLKSQMQETRSLMEQWGQQGDSKASEFSMNMFNTQFNAYQQMLEGMENVTKKSFESFQQTIESFEKAGYAATEATRK